MEPLISVIVPAYNAEATLLETLESISAQTHRSIEVLVVDDGSCDSTADLVRRHARRDNRVRLLHQTNGGVAAARNRGAHEADSDLLAFIDADDLWAPDKLARQLSALEAAGPEAGLCYAWYAMIDRESRITYREDFVPYSGWVLDRLILNNFIGNGSSALVRRAAFDLAGGFETGLRAAKAQGCEDILFYCRVAERFSFALVPDYLVGYRQYHESMSGDLAAMLRSWLLVVAELQDRHPDKDKLLREGVRRYSRWLARRAIHRRQPMMLARIMRQLASSYPRLALRTAILEVPATFRDRYARPPRDGRVREQDGRFAVGEDYRVASQACHVGLKAGGNRLSPSGQG